MLWSGTVHIPDNFSSTQVWPQPSGWIPDGTGDPITIPEAMSGLGYRFDWDPSPCVCGYKGLHSRLRHWYRTRYLRNHWS